MQLTRGLLGMVEAVKNHFYRLMDEFA